MLIRWTEQFLSREIFLKLKLQEVRGIKRTNKVELEMEALIAKASSLRRMLAEVTKAVTRVFMIPLLIRTFLFVYIPGGGTLMNVIWKLELILVIEKLNKNLYIAQRDVVGLQMLRMMKDIGRNLKCKGVSLCWLRKY